MTAAASRLDAQTGADFYARALELAKEIDPDACSMDEEVPEVLLVSAYLADRVIAALGDSFLHEDPNDPPTEWTRIVVRDPERRGFGVTA